MRWILIVVWALFITACNKTENTTFLENEKKNVRIDRILLFGEKENLINYYINNDYYTIWRDSLNRKDLISSLIDSQYDGILLDKYPLKKLLKYHFNYALLTNQELKKADIEFSKTFFKLSNQLASGKVNPKKLYGDWEPYIANVDYNTMLKKGLHDTDLYEQLEKVKPTHEFYKKYKKAFAKYVPITSKDTLSPEGYLRKKIWVNFERTKWLVPNLGDNYVWINLPEYELNVVEYNEIIKTHKVIIGKKERRTPVLSSAFNGIIINPKWTVPPTILKNDVVPKATANRGYFASNRLTIFDKKSGKQVSAENWNPANYSAYRYVQQTGKLNSLGQIKFDFPNKHMVYLHDTNNRTRFVEATRALSSGCVRVENPFDLAETIFQIEEVAMERAEIDTLVVREKTKNIKLNKKVNVHQVYFTAVVDETGSVKILNDVYSLDNILYKRLIQ